MNMLLLGMVLLARLSMPALAQNTSDIIWHKLDKVTFNYRPATDRTWLELQASLDATTNVQLLSG
jgi:hypothetical protein